MAELDPALTVACPLCKAERGQPCLSRNAVSVHQARRSALQGLTSRANAILRKADGPSKTPAAKRKRGKRRTNRRS
jgi:hypothetical protein